MDETPRRPDPLAIDKRTARGIYVVAFVTAVAPFVVQTATLVLTGSTRLTIIAGVLLAAAFIALAIAFQARQVGSVRAIGAGSIAGIALAVFTYHCIAFPVAHILDATLFSNG
jgi:hypothetical protein